MDAAPGSPCRPIPWPAWWRGAILLLGSACAWAATPAAGQETAWTVSRGELVLEQAPSVRETRWTASRPPGGEHDRIGLHRYRAAEGVAATAVLLYLPGTNMNGEAAIRDERHNLWLFLAAHGVEVFALDYRTHFVPAEDDSEKRYMADWTLEAFARDVASAARKAREESGRDRLFVAGFSRGVTFAYAYVCSEPDAVAGLVVLDGTFKSHAAADAAANPGAYDFEAARQELVASGRFASDVAGRIGWSTRHELMSRTADDPSGPATAPDFATVGEQVASILYQAWRPGGLANPRDGISRVEVLARLLDGYDRWWPNVQNVEGRSIASFQDDPRTALDDRWGELEIPVLYFGATGMGATWILDGVYSAAKSGSEDVTLHVLEGYGHLDVLVGERAGDEVFEPVRAWIEARQP